MKLSTNIVLVNGDIATQPYVVELIPSDNQNNFIFQNNGDFCCLFKSQYLNHLLKDNNDWYGFDYAGNDYNIKQATIKLYLPQYSVDTFKTKTKYILSLSTYINGKEVELGNFLFERKDVLACAPVRFNGMNEYCEYIEFSIVNPYELQYSTASDPSEIRSLMGQPSNSYTVSSLLHACLFVVDDNGENYIKNSEWTGGQNSVMFADPDDLSLHIKYDAENRNINLQLTYNDSSISDYFEKYYNCENPTVEVQYVVMDNDNIYYEQTFTDDLDDEFNFNIDTQYDNSLLNDTNIFESWANWKDGLFVRATISFYNSDEPFMTLFSNKMILSKELFSKMVQSEGYNVIKKIILDDIEMTNVNLTATNTITQNITVVSPTDSTKNHLMQPVFYQTREINNIIVHPSVTENIAIGLDSYKSQVKRFKIQIEGIVFGEIGRTGKGVIFKVIGNMLPKEVNEGTLYVLNENNDLVTTGKYTYSF